MNVTNFLSIFASFFTSFFTGLPGKIDSVEAVYEDEVDDVNMTRQINSRGHC